MLNDAEVIEQLHLLQQELRLTGEALETLQRDQRARLDALRPDMEALQRCLLQLHPDFANHYATIRTQLIQEIDPETILDAG